MRNKEGRIGLSDRHELGEGLPILRLLHPFRPSRFVRSGLSDYRVRQKFSESCYYLPEDNDAWREKYEGSGGGTCGPSCLAVLTRTTVRHIVEHFSHLEDGFKGYTPIADMKEMLRYFGYDFKYIRGGKANEFPRPATAQAIVRIQWLQDDGTEYYWRAAGAHTHYVFMAKDEFGTWVCFCNDIHWFFADGPVGRAYLKKGFVSSYLEITKRATLEVSRP